jgi:aspartyl-tRNA(Asn)/glutamyl-tRNA(Gln) amidotransferase subunit A
LKSARFAVPQTVVLDGLSAAVAQAFSAALARLAAAGATILELPLREFARAAEVNPRGVISSVEAYWWHRAWIEKGAAQYDPRVLMRIKPGAAISAADYLEILQQRKRFVADIAAAVRGCDALLMPTTPDTAPTIAEVAATDDSYFRCNGRMLRNPSLVNLFDGCALTLPCQAPGAAPVGLMIAGASMRDRQILALGLAVEAALR